MYRLNNLYFELYIFILFWLRIQFFVFLGRQWVREEYLINFEDELMIVYGIICFQVFCYVIVINIVVNCLNFFVNVVKFILSWMNLIE